MLQIRQKYGCFGCGVPSRSRLSGAVQCGVCRRTAPASRTSEGSSSRVTARSYALRGSGTTLAPDGAVQTPALERTRLRLSPQSLALAALATLVFACSSPAGGGATTPSAGAGGQASGNGGGGASAGTTNNGVGGGSGSGGAAQAGAGGSLPVGAAGASGSSSGGVGGGAGGAVGAAGAAGSGGSAGGSSFPDPSTFVCNAMIGVSVTADWFNGGFEAALPGDHWQLQWQSLAFVEQWADPTNAVWKAPIVSACKSDSATPDRVIFTGVNWTFTTADEWETQLTKAVETFRSKFPGVKEIDLMTMLRAPNNQICGQAGMGETNEQVVQPFVDQALAAVGAKYPNLVRILPDFYAPSCAVFQVNSPHYADGQFPVVAKVYSDYFMNH
jgi:hypothetical protein